MKSTNPEPFHVLLKEDINPKHIPFFLFFLTTLLFSCAVKAEVLDILSGSRLNAQPVIEWCTTDASATVETVNSGGCQLQTMTPDDNSRGFDQRAFWLRLELANPGTNPEERWITVGHPRTAEISLFSPNPHGWTRHDTGNQTPLSQRGKIEQVYGVLPVNIPAGSHQAVWMRVHSDTAVDLTTTVWLPDRYLEHNQVIQFWVTLAIGGVMVIVFFSMLMFVLTRQIAYLYFALAYSATLFNASLTAGLLQRYIWPADWPLSSGWIAASTLFGVLGYYGFMTSLMPQISAYKKTFRIFKGCVWLTAFCLMYAMLGNYGKATTLGGAGMLLTFLTGTLLIYRAWRDGDRVAGILLIAFGIMQLFLVVIRLIVVFGHLGWFPELTLLGPWTLVLTSPVILLGLMKRTRKLLAELIRAQVESETQLAFLSQMSHELRSPLDSILGNAQLLARREQNALFREGFSNIFDSGLHLLRMIDHILDYARGMAGVIKIAPEPVALASFLRGVERTARMHAARQSNRFVLVAHKGPTLMLDSEHLRRVLDNLLSNAARHTQNGLITLYLKTSSIGHQQLQLDFAVSDTGEGIAPEHQERIFSAFEQVRKTGARDGKGVGLGLAIARQLTELMGGHLTVESQPGQGATFRFSIVAKMVSSNLASPVEQLNAFDAEGYTGRRRTILLVDDTRNTRAILAELLEDLGFHIVEAENGQTAAERIKTMAELDLVITDQYMPEGDGWMVLSTLSRERPDVPALLVSAAPPCPPPDWPVNKRFEGTFLRPVDHGKLIRTIGDVLGLTWTERLTEKHPTLSENKDPSNAPQQPAPVTILSKPDPALVQELANLVETGQVTAIREWAMALKDRSPEHTAFSDGVLEAVQKLDFKTLKTLSRETG